MKLWHVWCVIGVNDTHFLAVSRYLDPVVRLQLPVIAQIIRDEVWLEGERRGRPVSSDDPVVCEKVCAIILRVGQQLRERFEVELAGGVAERAADEESQRAA